jgi:hypothetical protein
MKRLLLLVGVVVTGGCNARLSAPPPAPEPSTPAAATAMIPTPAEVLAYIDGKQLPLPDDDRPLRFDRDRDLPPDQRTIALERAKVTALEVEATATRVEDKPWSREVRFLYTDGPSTYAVVGRISYREVNARAAFFGFSVTEVARQ